MESDGNRMIESDNAELFSQTVTAFCLITSEDGSCDCILSFLSSFFFSDLALIHFKNNINDTPNTVVYHHGPNTWKAEAGR